MTDLGLQARVILPNTSALPADNAVNVFNFNDPTITPSDVADWMTAFYNTTFSGFGTRCVGGALGPQISRATNRAVTEIYRIPGTRGSLGSPIYTRLWTVHARDNADAGYPAEVALVGSYNGALDGFSEEGAFDAAIPTPRSAQRLGAPATHAGTTRPKSRHRGRHYFGPLGVWVGTPDANGEPRPTAQYSGVVNSAYDKLIGDSTNRFAVFSRREWSMDEVVGGWTDDSFDTVRGRGVKATTRHTWVTSH